MNRGNWVCIDLGQSEIFRVRRGSHFSEENKMVGTDLNDLSPALPARSSHLESAEAEIDLAALLRTSFGLARQNLILILGVVVGIVALGVVITLLTTPKYQSSAKILIEDQAEQIIEGSNLQQAVSASETKRFLQTQLGVITSRSLATFIVEGAGLYKEPGFFEDFGSEMPEEAGNNAAQLKAARVSVAVRLLSKALEVEIPDDSRIVTLTITSRSAQRSARIANLYAQRYIQFNLNQKYESSSYARDFLSSQLEQTREKLTKSEQDLNRYARAAGLIRVSGGGGSGDQDSALSVTNNQLVELNSAAADATAERIAAQDRWNTMSGQPALTIPEVASNTAVSQLTTAKAQAESELAELLSTHRDEYATVKAKRAQIQELNSRLQAVADSIKRAARLNYQAALEKENSLDAEVANLRDAALKEQDRGVQYSILKREADTNRALYESLLSRYNQLNASAGAASNNVTIVDKAIPFNVPSSPNLMLNIFIFFTLGLLLAAAIVALRYLLDDAVGSPQDLEKKLGLPLLGLVPMRGSEDLSEELKDPRSSVNEAYRSLVTNLQYSSSTGLPKVLLVTSARAGEGKSTTAKALATDIARLGNRTLLVDADLRRPTLHQRAGLGKVSGLTDVLIGQKGLDEVVHLSKESPNLSYVSALPMPPDPSLLLAGHNVPTFLATARARFDVVVLDCPPLLGLSDVPVLANHADGILFVIDSSNFQRGVIKSALRRLELINARVLGVVLNRFNPKSGSGDYAYYAYDYYSYGREQS